MYSASRTNIKNVVEWLRGTDETRWEQQTRLLFEAITELGEMSRLIPPRRFLSRGVQPELVLSKKFGITDGMPYLRGMLSSMFAHNRRDALEYGETALEFLPEG